MVRFKATILQYGEMGEKTGWSYIRIPGALAQELKPGTRRSFRVKGRLDDHRISGMALLPVGQGEFIMALKAEVRKAIGKERGAELEVELEADGKPIVPPKELLECLADEPRALAYFKSLPLSHQNYFGNWIKEAKAEATRTKRIARVVDAMSRKQNFAEMLKAKRDDRKDFFSK